jgi:hypothetical protein
MFRCERCGTGFSPRRVLGVESCPRCLTQDGVSSRLIFKLFEPGVEGADAGPRLGGKDPDRRELTAEGRQDG